MHEAFGVAARLLGDEFGRQSFSAGDFHHTWRSNWDFGEASARLIEMFHNAGHVSYHYSK